MNEMSVCKLNRTSSRILMFLAVVLCQISCLLAAPASKTFHISKGIDEVHEVALDGRTCQFTYRAANSAHGEAWHMHIFKEGDEEYICVIEDMDRAPPHATFFGWSAHVYGAKSDQITSSELWNHEGVLLENDDYIRDGFTMLFSVVPGQQLFYYGTHTWPDSVRNQMYAQWGGSKRDLNSANDYAPKVLDGTDLAGTEYWMPHSLDSPYYAASGA